MRPTIYKPEYCEMLLTHMTEGLSFESFAGVIGSSRTVLYDWCKVHPEFLYAKNAGAEAGLLYWERMGRDSMHLAPDVKFASSVYIFTMKARFKWADQIVVKDEKAEAEKAEYEKLRRMSPGELRMLISEGLKGES